MATGEPLRLRVDVRKRRGGALPFLIDSVTNRFGALGYTIVRHFHPVVGTTRDASGSLVGVGPGRDAEHRESIQHYELAETLTPEQREQLEAEIRKTLNEVSTAVRDFEPMRFAVRRMAHYVFEDAAAFDRADVEEAVAGGRAGAAGGAWAC